MRCVRVCAAWPSCLRARAGGERECAAQSSGERAEGGREARNEGLLVATMRRAWTHRMVVSRGV